MRVRVLKLLLICLLILSVVITAGAQVIPVNLKTIEGLKKSDIQRLIASNRYSHMQSTGTAENRFSTEGFELLVENDLLQVYLRRATSAIRVVDRVSGYIWGGVESDKPEGLNKIWSRFANSLCAVEYFDQEGLLKSVGANGSDVKVMVSGKTADCQFNFSDLGLAFDVVMTLEETGISFSLDDKTIRETKDYTLATVSFLPFFGSVINNEIGGYFLLPDGCGALMPFESKKSYLSGYQSRVYGADYAIDDLQSLNDLKSNRTNDFMVDEEQILFPVFGVVHGAKQNAFFAAITAGSEYASIEATPSGVVTEYNWICAKFIYRQKYVQPITKVGTGVNIEQKTPNIVNPAITYTFLNGEDADYVGMAKYYREMLEENGVLMAMKAGEKDIPLSLDFIAADIEQRFIGSATKEITGLEFIETAVAGLADAGIDNRQVTIKGWQPGGLNGYSKREAAKKSVYGAFSALTDLKEQLTSKGGNLLLALSPLAAKTPQLNLRRDTGITLSQSIIKITRDDPNVYLPDTYYIKPVLAAAVLEDQAGILQNSGFNAFAVEDYGSKLYGEYLDGSFSSRTEVLNASKKTLKKLSGNNTELSLSTPNFYALAGIKSYKNTPMTGSQYLFESDSVPFLQIVLSGSVELTAPYTNQGFYSRLDILKQIDYNTYPSFLLTELDNYNLKDTACNEFHSTRFENWQDTIADVYKEMNSILSSVYGQKITGRENLTDYVVKVTYETGAVYINYGYESYTDGDVSVEPLSAVYMQYI